MRAVAAQAAHAVVAALVSAGVGHPESLARLPAPASCDTRRVYLDELAPSWRDFQRRQLAQARVLVVDDDPGVCGLLCRLLEREGFTVGVTDTVADAWTRLSSEPCDLALIDAHLADDSGLELVEKVRSAALETECVLITGYATAETVDRALALGAADYLTKPIEGTAHFVGRIRAVLDRRITTLLFDVILGDLSKAVHGGQMEPRAYMKLHQDLLAFQIELGRRWQVLLVDVDPERAEARRAVLAASRLAARVASPGEAQATVAGPGALVAVVALESPGALEHIDTLHAADEQLEVLACADSALLETALAAVDAGAADFALLGREGSRALATRVQRLLRRARRHRLYLHLVTCLDRAAREVDPSLADDLIFAIGGRARR